MYIMWHRRCQRMRIKKGGAAMAPPLYLDAVSDLFVFDEDDLLEPIDGQAFLPEL